MPKLLINLPDGTQAKYGLNGPSFTIGRAADNDIVLPAGAASSHHAVIRLNETGDYTVTDLDSTNKTQVNGRPVQTSPLRHGDALMFGDVPANYFSEIPVSAPYYEDQPTQIYERPGAGVGISPPAKAASPPPAHVYVPASAHNIHRPVRRANSGDGGCFSLIVMGFVIPAAFFCGLVARHHQTTGTWFWDYVREYLHS
ncbi:MAG: FHA domain-containing protein [Verrucomicrobiota bacterium]